MQHIVFLSAYYLFMTFFSRFREVIKSYTLLIINTLKISPGYIINDFKKFAFTAVFQADFSFFSVAPHLHDSMLFSFHSPTLK